MKYTLISTLVIALGALSCGGNGNGDDEAAQGNEATTAPGAATTAASDPTTAPGDATPGGQQPPASAGSGDSSVVIDGETYTVNVLRCELFEHPLGGEPHEDDLSIVAFSDGGGIVDVEIASYDAPGGFLQQNVSVGLSRSGSDGTEQFSSTATHTADDEWYVGPLPPPMEGSQPLPNAPVQVSGDRITGGLTIEQDWPEGATGSAEVSFDLRVPSEFDDC